MLICLANSLSLHCFSDPSSLHGVLLAKQMLGLMECCFLYIFFASSATKSRNIFFLEKLGQNLFEDAQPLKFHAEIPRSFEPCLLP